MATNQHPKKRRLLEEDQEDDDHSMIDVNSDHNDEVRRDEEEEEIIENLTLKEVLKVGQAILKRNGNSTTKPPPYSITEDREFREMFGVAPLVVSIAWDL